MNNTNKKCGCKKEVVCNIKTQYTRNVSEYTLVFYKSMVPRDAINNIYGRKRPPTISDLERWNAIAPGNARAIAENYDDKDKPLKNFYNMTLNEFAHTFNASIVTYSKKK